MTTPLELARLADKGKPQSNPLLKFAEKPTRAYAIRAKCAECMGCTKESINPGFRKMIRDCTAPACPLFQFRPYQQKESDEPEASE